MSDALQPGDLLFFNTFGQSGVVTHVGIYVSGTTMIDADSYVMQVAYDDFQDDYWHPKYLFARRYLNTPTRGNETTQALLNGTPWSGSVSYEIVGPASVIIGSTVPATSSNLASGQYTLVYQSGAPSNSVFKEISPYSGLPTTRSTQNLASGQTITFTLLFTSTATGAVNIRATLDAEEWDGTPLLYTLTGGTGISATFVPLTINGLIGQYGVPVYVSGGPPNSRFVGVSPSAPQQLNAGGSITYTLQFSSH